MRHPNGYGAINKLAGKRRRPFQVRLTSGWKIIDGVERQQYIILGYYESRQKAMIALAEYNKSPYDLSSTKTTFETVFNIVYDRNIAKLSKSSQNAYKAAFKKCEPIHKAKMTDLRLSQLQKLFDDNSSLSVSSQNNMKIVISMVFKYCMENDIIHKDYSAYIQQNAKEREEIRVPFSIEEISVLKDNIDYQIETASRSTVVSGKWVDTIFILLYTGVRINELLGIKREHVNLEKRIIDIHGTKNKAARRHIPIHDEIYPYVEKRLRESTSEYLLHGKDGKRMNYHTYCNNIFFPLLTTLKMKHLPHDTRHSFATYSKKCRIDPFIVKRILGHTSKDITEDVYTHTIDEELLKEINKLKY